MREREYLLYILFCFVYDNWPRIQRYNVRVRYNAAVQDQPFWFRVGRAGKVTTTVRVTVLR